MRLGLPHCPLVLQLHNTPDITDQRVLVSFINKHIIAECPDPTTICSEQEVAQQQAKYRNLVNTCTRVWCINAIPVLNTWAKVKEIIIMTPWFQKPT